MTSYLRQVFLIAQREWLESVSTSMFWIGAMAGPVLIVTMMVIASFIPRYVASSSDLATSLNVMTVKKHYALLDDSGLGDEIRNEILASDLKEFLLEGLHHPEANTIALLVEIHDELNANVEIAGEEIADLVSDTLPYLSFPEIERMENFRSTQAERFAVWWQSNREMVEEFAPRVSSSRFQEFGSDRRHSETELKEFLDAGRIRGYFVIPENIITTSSDAKFVAKNDLSDDLSSWYGGHVTNVVRRHRFDSVDFEEQEARWVMSRIYFHTNRADDPGDQQHEFRRSAEESSSSQFEEAMELGANDRYVPVIYQFVLWFTVFLGALMLLQGTVEEKSSKLVEVVLSNAEASHLLDGKIVGILATCLAVVGVWMGFAAIPIILSPTLSIIDPEFIGSVFNPIYVSNFFLYLVLGFLFFGYLFSAIGSCCSTIRDAQVLAIPANLLLFIPILITVLLELDLSGTAANIMKLIPPFTPFVMMNTAAEIPPWYTYVGILLWMVVCTAGIRWLASRIYRKGMLLEEKPKGIRGTVNLVKT